MKSISFLAILFVLITCNNIGYAQGVNDSVTLEFFNQLQLDLPQLEKVKNAVAEKDIKTASSELLQYYRKRNTVRHPEVNRGDSPSKHEPSEKEKMMAQNGLKHHFFVHKGYGYFDFGENINWQYWPIKDNEIRWQLNRMYWWIPMGKMYWQTNDEQYAQEWVFQLQDWIKDNPKGLSKENDRFAWRPLECSRRIQDQTTLFNYFVDSPSFTPEFLVDFLVNYRSHVSQIRQNYSEKGNHLLFEAQRMIFAGGFFSEFKDAKTWRSEGVKILLEEIKKQVFNDGYQFELCPNYHVASINIFLKALHMAQLCGFDSEFPQWYKDKVESMIMASINASFPDGVYPMYGDAKLTTARSMQSNFKYWSKVFPNNKVIQYYASNGKEGNAPSYLSKVLNDCGFYSFRNGWDKSSTVLIMKAGPSGKFHCQPDNGTFELWYKGVNLMPDAGCYVYAGSEEIMKLRNWYRQTRVHQTLTLNNQNITLGAKQLYWNTDGDHDIAIYENPSYDLLTHRRTVCFVDRKFFVLIDEAKGQAKGTIDLHFQLKEGDAIYDFTNNTLSSDNKDGKNVVIKSFSESPLSMIKEDVKVSYHYREEKERPGIAFQQEKSDKESVKFITVLYPYEGSKYPSLKAEIKNNILHISEDDKNYQIQLPLK